MNERPSEVTVMGPGNYRLPPASPVFYESPCATHRKLVLSVGLTSQLEVVIGGLMIAHILCVEVLLQYC